MGKIRGHAKRQTGSADAPLKNVVWPVLPDEGPLYRIEKGTIIKRASYGKVAIRSPRLLLIKKIRHVHPNISDCRRLRKLRVRLVATSHIY